MMRQLRIERPKDSESDVKNKIPTTPGHLLTTHRPKTLEMDLTPMEQNLKKQNRIFGRTESKFTFRNQLSTEAKILLFGI